MSSNNSSNEIIDLLSEIILISLKNFKLHSKKQ